VIVLPALRSGIRKNSDERAELDGFVRRPNTAECLGGGKSKGLNSHESSYECDVTLSNQVVFTRYSLLILARITLLFSPFRSP